MQLAGMLHHLPRVRHQLGKPLRLGERDYRVRGYHANRQSVTLDHEPHLLEPLRHALTVRAGPFIDVGVNTGQTLLKLLTLDPGRAYFGFEPQVGCCHSLQQFAADNALETVSVLPIALSDRDGVLPLYARDAADPMAGLRVRAGAQAFPAPARRGDGILTELGVTAPGIIKVDVEGGELEVLRGLSETLSRSGPILFFEVLPNFTGEDRLMLPDTVRERNHRRAADLMSFLIALGYRVSQIDDTSLEHPISRFDLDDRVGFRGADFVAYPPGVRAMAVRLNKKL